MIDDTAIKKTTERIMQILKDEPDREVLGEENCKYLVDIVSGIIREEIFRDKP